MPPQLTLLQDARAHGWQTRRQTGPCRQHPSVQQGQWPCTQERGYVPGPGSCTAVSACMHGCVTPLLDVARVMQRLPPMDRALRQAWRRQRRLRKRHNTYRQGVAQRQSHDGSASRASTRRTLHIFGQLPSSKTSRATSAMRPTLRRWCVRMRACMVGTRTRARGIAEFHARMHVRRQLS